jgi:hypothetical protein
MLADSPASLRDRDAVALRVAKDRDHVAGSADALRAVDRERAVDDPHALADLPADDAPDQPYGGRSVQRSMIASEKRRIASRACK